MREIGGVNFSIGAQDKTSRTIDKVTAKLQALQEELTRVQNVANAKAGASGIVPIGEVNKIAKLNRKIAAEEERLTELLEQQYDQRARAGEQALEQLEKQKRASIKAARQETRALAREGRKQAAAEERRRARENAAFQKRLKDRSAAAQAEVRQNAEILRELQKFDAEARRDTFSALRNDITSRLSQQKSAREILGVSSAAAEAKEREARARARNTAAANREADALRRTAREGNSLFFTFRRLFGAFAIFAVFRNVTAAIQGTISGAIRFASALEQSELSIRALLTATRETRDGFGQIVPTADALALNTEEARRQMQLLRQDSLNTVATFEELIDTFQIAIAPGTAAGLDVDQIRQFSLRISQAASALGVASNQLSEEIRSILTGTITQRTTRIATALGITNEDIRRAREAGNLFGFLQTRFAAFQAAGQEAAGTLAGLFARTRDTFALATSNAALPLFENLKSLLTTILEDVIGVKDEFGNLQPNPQFVRFLRVIFDRLADLTKSAEEFLKELDFNELTDRLKQLVDIVTEFAGAVQNVVLPVIQQLASLLGLAGSSTASLLGTLVGLRIVGSLIAPLLTLGSGLKAFAGGAVAARTGLAGLLGVASRVIPILGAVTAAVVLGRAAYDRYTESINRAAEEQERFRELQRQAIVESKNIRQVLRDSVQAISNLSAAEPQQLGFQQLRSEIQNVEATLEPLIRKYERLKNLLPQAGAELEGIARADFDQAFGALIDQITVLETRLEQLRADPRNELAQLSGRTDRATTQIRELQGAIGELNQQAASSRLALQLDPQGLSGISARDVEALLPLEAVRRELDAEGERLVLQSRELAVRLAQAIAEESPAVQRAFADLYEAGSQGALEQAATALSQLDQLSVNRELIDAAIEILDLQNQQVLVADELNRLLNERKRLIDLLRRTEANDRAAEVSRGRYSTLVEGEQQLLALRRESLSIGLRDSNLAAAQATQARLEVEAQRVGLLRDFEQKKQDLETQIAAASSDQAAILQDELGLRRAIFDIEDARLQQDAEKLRLEEERARLRATNGAAAAGLEFTDQFQNQQDAAYRAVQASLQQLQQGLTQTLVNVLEGASARDSLSNLLRQLGTTLLNEIVGAILSQIISGILSAAGITASAASVAAGALAGASAAISAAGAVLLAAAGAWAGATNNIAGLQAGIAAANAGLASTQAVTQATSAAGAIGRAEGGLIPHNAPRTPGPIPGLDPRDRVLVAARPGEYFIRPEAVRKLGTDLLDMANSGQITAEEFKRRASAGSRLRSRGGFAGGGMVRTTPAVRRATGSGGFIRPLLVTDNQTADRMLRGGAERHRSFLSENAAIIRKAQAARL